MHSKKKIRIIIDVFMSILMILLMTYQFIGNALHEFFGILMFVFVVLHNILNRKFYTYMLKDYSNIYSLILCISDLLLLLMMAINAVTAVMISRYVFSFMNILTSYQVRAIHVFSGWWIMIFIGIHIGLHYKVIRNYAKPLTNIFPGTKASVFIIIILIITDLFGVIGAFENKLFLKLSMRSTYSYYENSNVFWEIFKVAAIVCLTATIACCALEFVIKNQIGG